MRSRAASAQEIRGLERRHEHELAGAAQQVAISATSARDVASGTAATVRSRGAEPMRNCSASPSARCRDASASRPWAGRSCPRCRGSRAVVFLASRRRPFAIRASAAKRLGAGAITVDRDRRAQRGASRSPAIGRRARLRAPAARRRSGRACRRAPASARGSLSGTAMAPSRAAAKQSARTRCGCRAAARRDRPARCRGAQAGGDARDRARERAVGQTLLAADQRFAVRIARHGLAQQSHRLRGRSAKQRTTRSP